MPDRLFAYPLWSATALGALAATGFQPLALWPLTVLGVAGLIELVARAPGWKRAGMAGWAFGLGHFALGNNWIATSFTYQANMPAWLGWLGVVLAAVYLAIYPALAAMAAWGVARANRAALIPAFAGCWIVSEWLRSWVFTGYAWNPLGAVALGPFARPGLAALAPWLGTYGLSGLICLISGMWLCALRCADRWPRALAAAASAALFLVPHVSGPPGEGTIAFTLVQPDIRQDDLNNPALFEKQFVKTARLTLPKQPGERRVVFWPESGIPDYLRDGYPLYFYQKNTFAADPRLARSRIAQVVGTGSVLLTGAVDLEMRQGAVAGAQCRDCAGRRRRNPRQLCQGTSGALRRISAAAPAA
jgi:apolipoprotein N-acyltransferase